VLHMSILIPGLKISKMMQERATEREHNQGE